MIAARVITSPPPLDFQKRIPALDGLRGIAILAVLFYHYAGGLADHVSSSMPLRAIGAVVAFGWSGVDLFFVLSGFLITGILYDTRDDKGYYRKFYARRILRIFPIYYLLMVVCAILAPFLREHWRPQHLFFLVYLGFPAVLIWPSTFASSAFRLSHLWSLSVEEQFYACWPWVIGKLRSQRAMLQWCVVLAASALILRALLHYLGVAPAWPYTLLFCRMDALACGSAIAIVVRGPLREKIKQWAPFLLTCAAGATVAICALRHTESYFDPLIATLGYTATAIAYGALLVLSLRRESLLAHVLSLSVFRTFGKYSYGLYLYHFPLTAALSPMHERFVARTHSFVVGGIVYLVACLLINLLVAAASFHFFETPIMRLKTRFSY
jgi:peptidoglycan/LPS O-acetylase OafA/YrhL